MAWINSLVTRTGEDVAIYREAEGALGAYGDPASTWAVQATEKILITRPKASARDSIAGRIDDSAYDGYLLSTSVARSHDYLLLDGEKYEVINVDTLQKRGTDFGKVSQLRKMDEGD